MARVTVEDCLDKVPSRFALVMLVAKRAKQLMKGAQATVHARDNKYIVQSLREVAGSFVNFDRSLDPAGMISDIEKDLTRNEPTTGSYQTTFE